MKINFKRGASLLAVLTLVAVFAIGGVGAAFVTGGSLTGDGTDTVSNFNAEAGVNDTIQYNTTTSTDTISEFQTLQLQVVHDGVVHAEYTASDATVVSGGADSTNGLQVEWAVDHGDLDSLPGAPGEYTNSSFEVTEVNSADTEYNDTAEVAYQFSDSRSVIYPASGTTDSQSLTLEEPPEPGIGQRIASTVNIFSEDSKEPDVATINTSRSINGSQTDVVVFNAQSNVSDSFDDAAEGYTSSGDPVLGMTLTLNNEPVPVFYEAANTDVVDTSNDTYAVYDGEKTVVNLGSDYDGETSVDVFMQGQDPLDSDADLSFSDIDSTYDGLERGQITDEFGWMTYIATFIPGMMIGGGLFALAVPVGLKRRKTA